MYFLLAFTPRDVNDPLGCLAIGTPVLSFCLYSLFIYVFYRSIKNGKFEIKASTVKRTEHPFGFWLLATMFLVFLLFVGVEITKYYKTLFH